MNLIVDLKSAIPAYRQVVDQIRHYLVAGALKPGDRLPSVRRLAIDLGLHHNTIAGAYRTLASEGWLAVSRGKSVQVLPRSAEPPVKRSEQRRQCEAYARRLRNLVAEMRSSGLTDAWIADELRSLSGKGGR